MSNFITRPIVIAYESAIAFLNNLLKPDEHYIEHRNNVFNEIDGTISIQRHCTDIEVDFEKLDLSFIDDM